MKKKDVSFPCPDRFSMSTPGIRFLQRHTLSSKGKIIFLEEVKMKKFIVILLVLIASTAQAGVEFVGVDGVQTAYTASTGVLLMNDTDLVVTIDYDDGNPQSSISPASFNLSTSFVSGTSFAGGTFVFTDENDSSVILSGNVLAVNFTSAGSFLVGDGTAQVLVSNLAGYPVGPSDIVSITFNLNPAFTNFNQDYSGLSKVNFLVPEPATMALLGLGGLLLRRRKA
jgi:hypothetical protein